MDKTQLKDAFGRYAQAMAERKLFLSASGSNQRIDVQIGGLKGFVEELVNGINWDLVNGNPLSNTEEQMRALRNGLELTTRQLAKAQSEGQMLAQCNMNQFNLLAQRGNRIAEIEAQANDLHRQVDELCATRLKQDRLYAELEAKLAERIASDNERIAELVQEVKDTKAKFIGIAPVAEFVSRIKQADKRIAELEKWLEKANSDYVASVGHKQSELNELEERFKTLERRNGELEARWKRDILEEAGLAEQLRVAKQQVSAMSSDIQKRAVEGANARDEIQDLKNRVVAWQQAEHNLAAQLNLVRKECADKDRQINGLTDSVGTYIRQEGSLRECIRALDAQSVKLQKELAALKAETSVTIGRLTLYKTLHKARNAYIAMTTTTNHMAREKALQEVEAVEALDELK